VDGALALAPITGQINSGGRTQSDPLVLDVRAPFGGGEIQWSVVFLDAVGNQVATGVSARYRNDDPDKPASEVAFAITQLPATITVSTVFERADTVAYDAQAGGYTWSDQVQVVATARDAGIQEVTGTAVATLGGVAGMVWKQNDRYYLRGVPLAQNEATFEMHNAAREGYARRPFLLLDAFVAPGDAANHVLVEPDETTSGYHVRKVSLDPRTGAIDWDTSTSHGMFLQPVSAAALSSTGTVVAVNTDNGRLAWLAPVDTGADRPQLAAYTAGPGTQVGLLSSPVALAVTNPGIVVCWRPPPLSCRRSCSPTAPTSTSPSMAQSRSTFSTSPATAPAPATITSTCTPGQGRRWIRTVPGSTSRTSRSTTGEASTARTTPR